MPNPSALTTQYVHFDAAGDFVDRPALDAALAGAAAATDVFVAAHGWNNSFADARASYAELAGHMSAVADQLGLRPAGFAPLLLGVVWPSKALDDSPDALVDDGPALAASVPETLSPART